MRSTVTPLMFATLLSSASCSPLTNKVSGTVQGDSFAAASGMVLDGSQSGESNVPDQAAVVVLSTSGGVCSNFQNNGQIANSTQLYIEFWSTDSGGNPVVANPGSYAISNRNPPPTGSKIAAALFQPLGASCSDAITVQEGTATSGTITVETLSLQDGGAATGTFDLYFGADHLTGSFNTPFCDAPNGTMAQSCG